MRCRATPTRSCACESRTEAEPATARYDRQDAFYRKAQKEGFRSRAVYKLDDLLRRAGGLPRGATVVELGCWPGGWLQRLAEAVGPSGRVVGVDLQAVEPLGDPVVPLVLDVTEPDAIERIQSALGRPAHAVLSDAAPKLTGISDVDRSAGAELCAAALAVAQRVLRPKGFLIVKDFPGPESKAFGAELRRVFARVAEIRPEGRRSTSKEFYWLAQQRREPATDSRE